MDLMSSSKFREFITELHELMKCVTKVSLDEGRRLCTDFFSPPELVREDVYKIKTVNIQGDEGNEIPVRMYFPSPKENLPIFIYYHRGGWVFANVEEADPVCRKLANHLGCIIASVDYRLAPENPFPKPLNDCYDAFKSIAEHAEHFGANREAVIVGGESAGGNLAAAVALRARDDEGPRIALQLLIYPMINPVIDEKVYAECADQYFLIKDITHFFWTMYLQRPGDANNPYAVLDKATNLSDLPPALFITAEHDPLHVEAEHYAEALKRAGNKVIIDRFNAVIHGFLDLPIYENSDIISWIKRIKVHLDHLLSLESASAQKSSSEASGGVFTGAHLSKSRA
jgi:acetyl esterase